MPPSAGRVAALAIVSRAAVLAAGLVAAVTIGFELKPDRFRLSHNPFWNLPGRFDAGWYLHIARRGYAWNPERAGRQQNVAFFPAFPILMRGAGEILTIPAHLADDGELLGSNGNTRVVWGGALVAIGCFVAACVLLRRLSLERFGGADIGARAALLMSAYPFALYFSAPYSEGLFLLSALGAVLEMERGRPLPAAAWGLLAGLTRPNGWALTPALILLAAAKRRTSSRRWLWVSAAAPAAGTLVFSIYVWAISGDLFAWASTQLAWNRDVDVLGFFSRRFGTISEAGVPGYLRDHSVDAIVVLAVLFTLVTAVIAFRKLGPAYAILSLAYLIPALVVDIPSVGRMTSVLFPSFLALAAITTARQTLAVAAIWFPIQLWFAARFFTWQTPY
jgi:Mannosyltransferase (PIG-V)